MVVVCMFGRRASSIIRIPRTLLVLVLVRHGLQTSNLDRFFLIFLQLIVGSKFHLRPTAVTLHIIGSTWVATSSTTVVWHRGRHRPFQPLRFRPSTLCCGRRVGTYCRKGYFTCRSSSIHSWAASATGLTPSTSCFASCAVCRAALGTFVSGTV